MLSAQKMQEDRLQPVYSNNGMGMMQVLFAINKTYWLNEKGAVALADTFARKPERLQSRINETFRLLDANPPSLRKAIIKLEELSKDIEQLVENI